MAQGRFLDSCLDLILTQNSLIFPFISLPSPVFLHSQFLLPVLYSRQNYEFSILLQPNCFYWSVLIFNPLLTRFSSFSKFSSLMNSHTSPSPFGFYNFRSTHCLTPEGLLNHFASFCTRFANYAKLDVFIAPSNPTLSKSKRTYVSVYIQRSI